MRKKSKHSNSDDAALFREMIGDVKPISEKDKISSMCLSDRCLKYKSLEKASRYIREKRKLPKFDDKLIAKATKLVEAIPEGDFDYTEIGLGESFFDFQGFEDRRGEIVKVHAIGKPPQNPDNPDESVADTYLGNDKSTYQVLEWEIGKDISIDEADMNVNDKGELFIEYTWVSGRGWIWRHVSQVRFRGLQVIDSVRGSNPIKNDDE